MKRDRQIELELKHREHSNNCLGNTAAGRASQYWTIAKGAGAVKLANTNYCLDFGLSPANGAIGKIWTCYDGAPQQNAYYTDDNHIALTGGCEYSD